MTSQTALTFICTVRGVDTCRIDNCIAVLRWYSRQFPDAQFHLVEQDTVSRFVSGAIPSRVSHHHVYNPGAFNKAWGINVGFRASTGEILVILDADMLVEPGNLRRSVAGVARELHVVRPFRRLIDLGPDETRIYHETGNLMETPDGTRGFDRGYLGERICLAGGVFVIRRSLFELVGGFDERFLGWGGEDDAFSLRVEAATGLTAIAREGTAWHLWHPRQAGGNNPHYSENVALLQAYRLWRSAEGPLPDVPSASTIGDVNRYREPTV